MRRIFNRRACRRHRTVSNVLHVAALAVVATALSLPARAGEELLLKAGVANHLLLIREHAAWNMDCRSIPYPAVRLDRPPRHGPVCARFADVTIRSMYTGTEVQCIGRVVQGLRLVYVPRPGFAGSDGLSYSVQYPSVRRSVAVRVTVGAEAVALPADVAGAAPPAGQAAGPVPPCAMPVS